MDERDAAAAARSSLRVMGALWVFVAFWVAPPLLFGGVHRGDAVFVAGMALVTAAGCLFVTLAIRSGRTATKGPLAGLGPADYEEVGQAVNKGRAVSMPALAGPAVAQARQTLRWQSPLRYIFPVLIALRAGTIVVDAPGLTGTTVAYAAAVLVPLLVLWGLCVVGYRRASQSEEANWRLVESGGAA